MGKYHKKKKDVSYELKDYDLLGHIDFAPYIIWVIILFFVGIYLSFKFSTGFFFGLLITIGLPSGFYALAHELGNKEIDFLKSKIDTTFNNFQKYLNKHCDDLIK